MLAPTVDGAQDVGKPEEGGESNATNDWVPTMGYPSHYGSDPANYSTTQLYTSYRDMHYHLSHLRSNYQLKYSHIPFDWGLLDTLQKSHKMMHLYPHGDALKKVLANQTKVKALYKSVERISAFLEEVPEGKGDFARKLQSAVSQLSMLYARLFTLLWDRARHGNLGVPQPPIVHLEKRDQRDLSVEEFVEKYAKPGIPVVITGLNISRRENWTLDFFRDTCGSKMAQFKKKDEQTQAWGGLVQAGVMNISDFIETFTANDTRRSWYLHDWSLPSSCPAVFGPPPYAEFVMPRYFAGDYFQRAAFEGYRHAWPSLFIGAAGTESRMHIDSGGTNFWLYLLSGRKEWRFYSRKDLINIGMRPASAHFTHDPFQPNSAKNPLAAYATEYRMFQDPGDLVFIPGGNPHAVRNLDDIHGISMNYVDLSNLHLYISERLYEDAFTAVETMTEGAFPRGLRKDQKDLLYGEWKSVPWNTLSYDLF